MKRLAAISLALVLVLPLCGKSSDQEPASLFAQSASAMLSREFASLGVSYLLVDAHTARILATRWDDAERPIPIGSLVKPFTAIAYARVHGFRFPEFECTGGRSCWLPRGHGHVDFEHALADSCNAYFHSLAENVSSAEASSTMQGFGLQPPSAGLTTSQLVGLDDSWRIAPARLALAYLELARHPLDPGVREVLSGMSESARSGTAQEVDRAIRGERALAKTGTAACTHGGAPGDGFTVAMAPADAPSLLLMVRVHGVPGSRAAATAGKMLRRLQETTGFHE